MNQTIEREDLVRKLRANLDGMDSISSARLQEGCFYFRVPLDGGGTWTILESLPGCPAEEAIEIARFRYAADAIAFREKKIADALDARSGDTDEEPVTGDPTMRIDLNEVHLELHDERIDVIEKRFKSAEVRLDLFEARLKHVYMNSGTVAELRTDIKALDTRTDDLSELRDKLDDLDCRIEALQGRLPRITN